MLMAWCFSTRALVGTVLTTHPCVSRCLRVNGICCLWAIVGATHDDVIKWKHFPRYWPFVRGIQRSPVNSPHKGQWRGALMFSFICVWINNWVNNREAGDLRCYRAHYDVIVMYLSTLWLCDQIYVTHLKIASHKFHLKVSDLKMNYRDMALRCDTKIGCQDIDHSNVHSNDFCMQCVLIWCLVVTHCDVTTIYNSTSIIYCKMALLNKADHSLVNTGDFLQVVTHFKCPLGLINDISSTRSHPWNMNNGIESDTEWTIIFLE